MKKKFILTMLATFSTCLIGCGGGANNVYGQTIAYKGVFDVVDEKYNSDYSDKTTRQLVSENMSNINWDNIGISIPHATADEAITAILNHNKQVCDKDYAAIKIVMGSEKEKTAKITTADGEKTYSVTDTEGVFYDFKDSNGDRAFEYKTLNIVNGKVSKGVLTYVNLVYSNKVCSNMIELPLKQSVTFGTATLDKIQVVTYANFTN